MVTERVSGVWQAAAYDSPTDRSAMEWCVLGFKVVGVGMLLALLAIPVDLFLGGLLPAQGTVARSFVEVYADVFSGLVNGVLALAFMLVAKAMLRVAVDEGYFSES